MSFLNFIFLQCFEAEIQIPYSEYKLFSHPQQNHSSVTLFAICVYMYECPINKCTKFYLPTVFQSCDRDPSLKILKRTLQVIKSPKRDNIICVYALNRNKHAKLYLSSTFQTSDIELLSQKIETQYTSY